MVYTEKAPQASITVKGSGIQFKYGASSCQPKNGLKTVVRQPNPSKRKAIK